jgi:uncharacterized protein (TIGR03000 family)
MTHAERKAARRAYRQSMHSSHGSSGGSYGSSGGSYSSFYSGSSGGSSGGSYGSYGGYSAAANSAGYSPMSGMTSNMAVDSYRVISDEPVGDKAAATSEEVETPAPAKTDSTMLEIVPADGALLMVRVPAEAQVFVNGSATKATGSVRRFVSRGLEIGKTYEFVVRMVTTVEGRETEQTRTVRVSAGEQSLVAFAEASEEAFVGGTRPKTSLTLHVPAEARVWLAGNPTASTGETRVFETTGLTEGQVWPGYEIRVTTVIDGREITIAKTIDLAAGAVADLTLDPRSEEDRLMLVDATASTR